MVAGGDALRKANGGKEVDISAAGRIPEAFRSVISENKSEYTGVVKFPVFGIEFESSGRLGDEIFARIELANETAFDEFKSSLLYIQFFRRQNSADTVLSQKILFSLSDTDRIFETAVIFMDKLGNENVDRVKIHVYKDSIQAIHRYLADIGTTQILTDAMDGIDTTPELLSTDPKVTPDPECAANYTSYDFLTASQRIRVRKGEAITAYNLIRNDSTFVTEMENAFTADADVEVLDGFENSSGELDFICSGGHDGIFDKISPVNDEGETITVDEANSLIAAKLYSAYKGTLIPEIRDLERCRWNFCVDSMLPFEVKQAMIDLCQEFPHSLCLTYLGDQEVSSFEAAQALKDYRFDATGEVDATMAMFFQTILATQVDVAPIAKRMPVTIDFAYKIGKSWDSAENMSKAFAGKDNMFGRAYIGDGNTINEFPDRTAGAEEHKSLADNRINFFEQSLEGPHMMSDLTNNSTETRLSSIRNKLVLGVIYLFLYRFLSNKRFSGSALSAVELTSINNYGAIWSQRGVIDSIRVVDVTDTPHREQGIYQYRYEIGFHGIAKAYEGVIDVKKATAAVTG
jgi:hypothetical protein